MSEQVKEEKENKSPDAINTEETEGKDVEKEEKPLTLEEEVTKEMEEGEKQAKKMSQLIKISQKREVKPNSLFFSYIDDAQKELNDGLAFLKKAELDPKLLFTDSDIHLKSRGMMMAIMNHWRNENEYVKGHDFQVYVADVANRYFQDWLRQKGINEPFRLEVRNPNQFPSIFAVYHEEVELLQCNLQKKWYGVRKRPFTEEEILYRHEKGLARIEKEMKETEEELKRNLLRRDEPLKYYKGLKNRIQYLFIDKKKLYESFDKFVKREESILAQQKKEKEFLTQSLPKMIEESKKKGIHVEQVEAFFVELGYELNKVEGSLY